MTCPLWWVLDALKFLGTERTIGIFGVGTKRAVVALAQEVRIRTRQGAATYLIEFDDAWLKDSEDWHLPVYEVPAISPGSTHIELLPAPQQDYKRSSLTSCGPLGRHLRAVPPRQERRNSC